MPIKKIAVVIPLYNKAAHIAETLESVLTQSSPPDEVIIVDDGSTDGSNEIVSRYTHLGISLIRQKNQGESAARNTGINASDSNYVAFLDADDSWYPNHIKTLRELISRHPDAALLSSAHIIRRGGHMFKPSSAFPADWTGIVPDFFSAYCVGLSLVNSTTACASRDALLDIGGFPVGIRRGPDVITWIRLALKFPVAHTATVTAVYNRDAINRTDRLMERTPPGSLVFMSELLQDASLPLTTRKSIGLLFDRIAIFTAAGFCLNSDKTGLAAIRQLAKNTKRWQTTLFLLCLSLAPKNLLLLAQKYRHRRTVSH